MKTDEENFPEKVRAFIRARNPRIRVFPHLESTDEVLRDRRTRFGEYMLFANALVDYGGRVVLIQQHFGEHMEGGRWMFPGGGVFRHEEIPDAAVREVKEETGLDIELLDVLGMMHSGRQAPTEGTIDTFLVTFAARAIGGELHPLDTDEVAAVRLATVEEVEELIDTDVFSIRDPRYRASDVECFRRWAAAR